MSCSGLVSVSTPTGSAGGYRARLYDKRRAINVPGAVVMRIFGTGRLQMKTLADWLLPPLCPPSAKVTGDHYYYLARAKSSSHVVQHDSVIALTPSNGTSARRDGFSAANSGRSVRETVVSTSADLTLRATWRRTITFNIYFESI